MSKADIFTFNISNIIHFLSTFISMWMISFSAGANITVSVYTNQAPTAITVMMCWTPELNISLITVCTTTVSREVKVYDCHLVSYIAYISYVSFGSV